LARPAERSSSLSERDDLHYDQNRGHHWQHPNGTREGEVGQVVKRPNRLQRNKKSQNLVKRFLQDQPHEVWGTGGHFARQKAALFLASDGISLPGVER
jgi:hypothetical protein